MRLPRCACLRLADDHKQLIPPQYSTRNDAGGEDPSTEEGEDAGTTEHWIEDQQHGVHIDNESPSDSRPRPPPRENMVKTLLLRTLETLC